MNQFQEMWDFDVKEGVDFYYISKKKIRRCRWRKNQFWIVNWIWL